MRDSFIFYRSFYEAIRDLPADVQAAIYTAIMEYSLYGIEAANLKPIAKSVFILIKPQIDANKQRFENGKKGGRPRTKSANEEACTKPNQSQTKAKANENVNVNANVNDNDNDNVNENNNNTPIAISDEAPSATKSKARFREPSLDEVANYCQQRQNNINPQRFVDHYQANGWMVGKNKMKNWKAAVRSWENNAISQHNKTPPHETHTTDPQSLNSQRKQQLGQLACQALANCRR